MFIRNIDDVDVKKIYIPELAYRYFILQHVPLLGIVGKGSRKRYVFADTELFRETYKNAPSDIKEMVVVDNGEG